MFDLRFSFAIQVLLSIPGWPWTHGYLPASVSHMLALQMRAFIPDWRWIYYSVSIYLLQTSFQLLVQCEWSFESVLRRVLHVYTCLSRTWCWLCISLPIHTHITGTHPPMTYNIPFQCAIQLPASVTSLTWTMTWLTFTVSCFQSYLRDRPLGLSLRAFPEKFNGGVKNLPIK